MNLSDLKNLVSDSWIFDENGYPDVVWRSKNDKMLFALKHITLHQAEAIGNLSSIIEAMDHGKELDKEALVIAMRKLMVNVMQMANVSDIHMVDLEREISEWSVSNKVVSFDAID